MNASVSNELKNPLQSVKSTIMEKQNITSLMQNYMKTDDFTKEELIRHIQSCLDSLQDGINLQDSAANFLSTTVQELIDYTQVSAVKFRKNIAQFNIRDAVAKVIQLQKKKASDQGIIIIPDFVNISRFQQSVELD